VIGSTAVSGTRNVDGRYCPNSKYTGIHVDGAFAEYEILDSRHLVELSDDMTFEQVGNFVGMPSASMLTRRRHH